ncbi:MAG: chain length determinant protein tyrosine kinase EpsG [Pseudomonadota bacterium]
MSENMTDTETHGTVPGPALAVPDSKHSANHHPGNNMGRLLLDMGKLTPEGAEQVLRAAKERGLRFGEAAVQLGLVSEEDIQQVLAHQFDYPYLHAGQGKYPPELVAAFQPFSPTVETLRAVRSQLMLRWFTEQRKSLVVACVNEGEGASFLAANLAVVFSQLGEHTLLVDANLRNPRQHDMFQLQERRGLSDILAGRADLSVITKVEYFVDLSVLAAGTLPPNPQELVSRTSFNELTQDLAARYDVILYDVAGFSTAADLMAVAACTEGVLLVVRKNQTRMAAISILNEQLTRNGIEMVGTVVVDF